MSEIGNLVDSSGAATASQYLKLEKAYLLVIPPSSPAGGKLAMAIGGIVASEGAQAGQSALQSSGSSGASAGTKAIQAASSEVGGNVGNKVTFLFNPNSYTIEKQGLWSREPDEGALSTSIPVWRGAGPRVMSVEVLLDASFSDNGGIQADIDLLFDCCKPTYFSLLSLSPSPPFVMFGWGLTLGFLAYMESVRAEYNYFRPDGTPLRAKCSLVMQEIPMSMPGQNPTSGGRVRRTRTVVAGDTLQSIAFREYGKPTMWRAIASTNGIVDPMRLAPGTTLLIPPVDEAGELA